MSKTKNGNVQTSRASCKASPNPNPNMLRTEAMPLAVNLKSILQVVYHWSWARLLSFRRKFRSRVFLSWLGFYSSGFFQPKLASTKNPTPFWSQSWFLLFSRSFKQERAVLQSSDPKSKNSFHLLTVKRQRDPRKVWIYQMGSNGITQSPHHSQTPDTKEFACDGLTGPWGFFGWVTRLKLDRQGPM